MLDPAELRHPDPRQTTDAWLEAPSLKLNRAGFEDSARAKRTTPSSPTSPLVIAQAALSRDKPGFSKRRSEAAPDMPSGINHDTHYRVPMLGRDGHWLRTGGGFLGPRKAGQLLGTVEHSSTGWTATGIDGCAYPVRAAREDADADLIAACRCRLGETIKAERLSAADSSL